MKKLLVAILLSVVMLSGCFPIVIHDSTPSEANTEQSVNTEQSEINTAEISETSEPITSESVSDSGQLGDYVVSIKNCEVIKDYEGKPALRVYFDFTNNSDEAANFMFTMITKAFQNGVELETAMVMDTVDEDDNSMKDIKPGVTLTCTSCYALSDSSSVEIEVSEIFSFDDSCLSKTFNIG